MPKVLLISTNRCVTPDAVFPLGLAHLSASLRQHGHDVRWFDVQIGSPTLAETLVSFQPHVVGISVRNIDDVLIRKRETYFDTLGSLCATIREHSEAKIVLGGSGFSIFPESLLALCSADYGICGPGERAFSELVDRIALAPRNKPEDHECAPQEQAVCRIPGLVYRADQGIRRNQAILDTEPPAFTQADWPTQVTDHYLKLGGMLNLQTQRGCAFQCCYCTYPLLEGRAHRRYEPEAVAAQFEQLGRLGARYAFIVDSVFNSSTRHVTEICELLLRRGNKLKWGCFLRPQGLTPDLVELMRRAGLAHVEFGTDSFSDRMLSAYQKGFAFDDIERASAAMAQAGIDYCHFLILGGPGETADTLHESFERSRRLKNAVIMAVVGVRIYPGTALCRRAEQEGVVKPKTDLLNPVYYVSWELSADRIFAELHSFAASTPNWIPGDPAPEYQSLVARLRARGVAGPLWSYFSMLQRIWPQGPKNVQEPVSQP